MVLLSPSMGFAASRAASPTQFVPDEWVGTFAETQIRRERIWTANGRPAGRSACAEQKYLVARGRQTGRIARLHGEAARKGEAQGSAE
jgi:hypothetical protein